MSNIRYLELNSTYRDRNKWPLPADFEVPIAQSGTKNRFTAEDPVSFASPLLTFIGSFRSDISSALTVAVSLPVVAPPQVALSNNPNCFYITATANQLRTPKDFYSGATITLTNGGVTAKRIIDSYEFITTGATDIANICVLQSLPDSLLTPGTTGSIDNPTDVNPGNLVYIPSTPLIDNFWVNCRLENVTRGEFKIITEFDALTRIATLSDSVTTGWTAGDTYLIRKIAPNNSGAIVGVTSSSIITLAASASTIDNIYNGGFLRIANPPGPSAPNSVVAPQNEMRRIVAYNGTTRTATVTPPFSVAPAVADPYEILEFSGDNAVPFTYTGSMVSQQEAVCYEIELLDLVLPNRTLNVGKGGRIAFYPYVYVELQNTSGASAGTKNIIYSNNPNAARMLFRCAIDDIPNPLASPFIKIDSNGSKQTIKFKINDNIRFSVRLPTGEIFSVVGDETTSPVVPNELLQISAFFSIKRL